MSPEGRDRFDLQAKLLVPGLADVLKRFRWAFPELSMSSLRRIFRLGTEVEHGGELGMYSDPDKAQGKARCQVPDDGQE